MHKTFKVGEKVSALFPNESWGEGVVIYNREYDPDGIVLKGLHAHGFSLENLPDYEAMKPLIVKREDETLGYFHYDQVVSEDAKKALAEIISEMMGKDEEDSKEPDEVEIHCFYHDGLRIAEIGCAWRDGTSSSGAAWMRSDPPAQGVLLAAEDYLLAYGYETQEGDPPEYDPQAEAEFSLRFHLKPEDEKE